MSEGGLICPDFVEVAGPAAAGALFTSLRDLRETPEAAEIMAAHRAEGVDDPNADALYSEAVFQVWAQAVEEAGSFDLEKVSEALHSHESTHQRRAVTAPPAFDVGTCWSVSVDQYRSASQPLGTGPSLVQTNHSKPASVTSPLSSNATLPITLTLMGPLQLDAHGCLLG